VIDLDGKEAKNAFKAKFPDLDFESIPRQKSGRLEGGWHLVFQHPGVPVSGRIGDLSKVDVKGNGYILGDPSIHISGKQYRWELPINGELPKLPVEIFKLISSLNRSR